MLAKEMAGDLEAHNKPPKVSASANGKKGRELRNQNDCTRGFIKFSTTASVQPHVERPSDATREPGYLIGGRQVNNMS